MRCGVRMGATVFATVPVAAVRTGATVPVAVLRMGVTVFATVPVAAVRTGATVLVAALRMGATVFATVPVARWAAVLGPGATVRGLAAVKIGATVLDGGDGAGARR